MAKRVKRGHEQTRKGICLLCFRHGKTKFWLSRANNSSFAKHYKLAHPNQTISPKDAVPDDSPLAVEAMKVYNKIFRYVTCVHHFILF